MRILFGISLLCAVSLAPAQDTDIADHVCVRELQKWVTFRDPDTIKVVSVSEGKAEVIDYADTRLVGVRFTVTVNSKGEQGGYRGPRPYQCYTSQDRRRVLNYSPRRD